ncbi:50S ribosomal protein L17 [Tuwongella immobilis]|uniref:Large ribosomal subunit protein bL17 n=1 Tax=Tuwongella immobilis TaxID=692036 RepID=A0A6C2YNL2_9BACT|nr:50s ribosomal protein l17 : 50S ribosomal protein L17 OS=Marinithermus hydrothermalis (strain DSM 14884 / JCM 11576 / T1) GN=rplQ PE=3 SV=1: Ribosomal_L17 [Tuwongella immobilis]VTS02230.1 50s ribosomal protein l17 : 50S ribosomal protein L17 OS=Marinithermus hydrothermalis (strain DSM 14884 / JCM 11576 / T1) GN=rplQ PE=3 SV=1: Ribosomal_L17 [Tuwongella immobilis]
MRHLNQGRKLGRTPSHRLALKRNLASNLITHGQIVTTVEKAKELRPFIEKLITIAKSGTLHARRTVAARLGPMSCAPIMDKNDAAVPGTILSKLFDEIAPRFKDRPGGYTRIIRRHERRLGDGGQTAYIAFLQEGEVKEKKQKAAPAPLAPAPASETAPESPAS